MKLHLFDWVTYTEDYAYSTFSDVRAAQARLTCCGLVIRISNKKRLAKVLWEGNLNTALIGRAEEVPTCFLTSIRGVSQKGELQENFWDYAEDDSGTNSWW